MEEVAAFPLNLMTSLFPLLNQEAVYALLLTLVLMLHL